MTKQPSPLMGRFLVLLGPLVLSNVLQAISGTVNAIYVGRFLGTESYAAVAAVIPLMTILAAFAIGASTGASILAGQAFGAGDSEKLRSIGHTSLGFAVLLGLIFAIVGAALVELVLRTIDVPAVVREQSAIYARVILGGLPLQFAVMTMTALLRSMGEARTTLHSSFVVFVIAAVLTPTLICGWLGFRLGVEGAALALVISQLVALSWLVWRLKSRRHQLMSLLFSARWRIDALLLCKQFKLGLPMTLFFFAGALADVGLLAMASSHGAFALAAWGIARQVMAYVQFPAMSIAIAASVLAAQAVGARESSRLAAIPGVALQLNLAIAGVLAVLVAIAAPWLVRIFSQDGRVVDIAASALRVTVWGSVFFGAASALTSVMRASGIVFVPTAISLTCTALVLNPVAYLLHEAFGLVGIWAAYPVTYLCTAFMQWTYFNSRSKYAPIQRLV